VDYSRTWELTAKVGGDDDLASVVARMEGTDAVTAADSRRRVVAAIGRRYALAG